jgi:parvulin-like peptidyl-prolyl isomerase
MNTFRKKIEKLLKKEVTETPAFKVATLLLGLTILYFLYHKGILAVAFVNGQPITITEIAKFYRKEKTGNVLEKIIAEKIIYYEAKKRNIQVSVEEVNTEIAQIEKEALENGKTMVQLLKESDKSAEDLEKEVRTKLIVYKILAEDIELSEDEIDKFLKDNPELYKNLGKQEARERVRRLLIDAKIRDEYQTWIQEAKASSDIRYFLKF